MGKITLNLAMSLDGFISDNNGGFDWIVGHDDSSNDTKDDFKFEDFLQEIDTIVMGSKAYEDVVLTNLDTYNDKDTLEKQVNEFHQDIRRLKLEKDILKEASKVIKKDQGINHISLINREKATIINALRDRYLLKDLLEILRMAKSSYSYQVIAMTNDKYTNLCVHVKAAFNEARSSYGYRRIHSVIKKTGTIVSEKVIRRIMREEKLIVPNIQRKKYSSYKGELSPEVENIIERNFHASKPNQKWLTDITEFRIPAGKIYLSPIIDCFDGLPVSWTIGTSPNANLVNTMLDEAISVLNEVEKPILHSDYTEEKTMPKNFEFCCCC